MSLQEPTENPDGDAPDLTDEDLAALVVLPDTNPFGEPITRARLDAIEDSIPGGFWNSTPQLQYIAAVAAEQGVSPWAVLELVEAHRLSHVPPNVVLVDRAGKPGKTLVDGTSLNSFGSIVSPPGGGKSVCYRVASGILPPATLPLPDGTGQGLLRNFAETRVVRKDDENKPLAEPYRVTSFFRHEMTVHAPEIKSLNAEFVREGTKTDTIIRQLWVGETVGMNNADVDRRVVIFPNMVRLAAAWGVQPINAAAILAQAPDGTPQRFVWAPAQECRKPYPARTPASQNVTFPMPVFDPRGKTAFGTSPTPMPAEIRDTDGYEALPEPIWVHWSPKMHAEIPLMRAEIEALGDREPYATIPPDQQAAEEALLMKSHLILTTIKQAAMMGFIHGRENPSDLDWDLAKAQMEVSTGEMSGVWKRCAEMRFRVAEDRGVDRAHEQRATRYTAAGLDASDGSRVRGRILAELGARGAVPARDIKRFFKSVPNQVVDAILDELVDSGAIRSVMLGRQLGYQLAEAGAAA